MISSNFYYKSKKKYHLKKSLQFNSYKTQKKQQQQGSGELLKKLSQLITSSSFFNYYIKLYKMLNSHDQVLIRTQRNKKYYDIKNKKEYTINYDQYGTVIMTELNSQNQQFSYWVYLESEDCLIKFKYSELILDNILSEKKTKKIPSYKYKLLLSIINDFNEKSSDDLIDDHSNSDQNIKSKLKPFGIIDSQDSIDLDLAEKDFEIKKQEKKQFDIIYKELKNWVFKVKKLNLDKIFILSDYEQDNSNMIKKKIKNFIKLLKEEQIEKIENINNFTEMIKKKVKTPEIKKFDYYQQKYRELEYLANNILNNPDKNNDFSNLKKSFKEIENYINIINNNDELEKICYKILQSFNDNT